MGLRLKGSGERQSIARELFIFEGRQQGLLEYRVGIYKSAKANKMSPNSIMACETVQVSLRDHSTLPGSMVARLKSPRARFPKRFRGSNVAAPANQSLSSGQAKKVGTIRIISHPCANPVAMPIKTLEVRWGSTTTSNASSSSNAERCTTVIGRRCPVHGCALIKRKCRTGLHSHNVGRRFMACPRRKAGAKADDCSLRGGFAWVRGSAKSSQLRLTQNKTGNLQNQLPAPSNTLHQEKSSCKK